MNLELKKIVDNNDPKQYANILKSKPNAHLKLEIDNYGFMHKCQTFNESFYCYYNNITPQKCSCGNSALFNNFQKGYRKTCGIKCPERYKKQSVEHSKFWQDNPEKKKEMIQKRIKHYLENYTLEDE